MKLIIRWGLFALVLAAAASLPCPKGPTLALFSWGGEVLQAENRPALLDTMRRLGAGTLYQEFPPGQESEAAEFLADMARAGIQVWLLTGRPEWGLERDGGSLREEIDRAAALREGSGVALAGLMADVEPYLTQAWELGEDAVLERYVDGMAAARRYAGQKGISLAACIPYWYDNHHRDALARLIRTGCDQLAVMNYYRGKEADHLRTELELARAAGVPVISISEFQPPGTHDLTEAATYYTEGLEAARQSWAQGGQALGRDGLTFACHWYQPLRELLDRAVGGSH